MRAKVWNDNPNTEWKESFKGEPIVIPSGKFIEMEFYDAHEFKSQFFPIKIKPDDSQDPKSYKMIRVEKLVEEEGELDSQQEVFPCNMCKKTFNSEDSLVKHSSANHADHVVTDAIAQELVDKKNKAKNKPGKQATT